MANGGFWDIFNVDIFTDSPQTSTTINARDIFQMQTVKAQFVASYCVTAEQIQNIRPKSTLKRLCVN